MTPRWAARDETVSSCRTARRLHRLRTAVGDLDLDADDPLRGASSLRRLRRNVHDTGGLAEGRRVERHLIRPPSTDAWEGSWEGAGMGMRSPALRTHVGRQLLPAFFGRH